jgi:hypothetical protein
VGRTQNRIPIIFLPFPAEICQHLVTDKHWFMENALCYLSNAVKYSSDGTVTIRACLRNENERESLRNMTSIENGVTQLYIIVEDEGIGISTTSKASLFQPFQQTMRLAGGTGLGLYSLSKRIEALGGKFGVNAREDGRPGTQFWFSIPYLPDIEFQPEASVGRSVRSHSVHSVKSPDIKRLDECLEDLSSHELSALVVDDSPVIVKATSRQLTKAGYTVDTADNGAVGLEKMKSKLYDVVLMDLQMPIMDGLEATRR